MTTSVFSERVPSAYAENNYLLSFSVVSHSHGLLVLALLESLVQQFSDVLNSIEIFVVFNVPDRELEAGLGVFKNLVSLKCIFNCNPKGFGENHNNAYRQSSGQWFVVLNPDILWNKNTSFGHFAKIFGGDRRCEAGLIVPVQMDLLGRQQDSMRKLITPWSLAVRLISKKLHAEKMVDAVDAVDEADWVNGACMFIRSDVYRQLGGFDERYFMYCEDADLCLRLQLAGYTMAQADFSVIHDARRDTTRKLSHLVWHVTSLLRFWSSSAFWKFLIHKRLLSQKRSGA